MADVTQTELAKWKAWSKAGAVFIKKPTDGVFRMDFEIEELENFFSQHFGWTPNSTPAASQVTDHEDASDDADDDGPADDTFDLDQRVMQFLDDAVVLDPHSDDGDGDDDKNEYQRSSASIENVPLPHDDPDLFKIRDAKIRGCGCKNKCVSIFSNDTLYSHILNMREMSKEEKDMYIMGSLVDSCKETTKWGKKRIRSRQTFMFSGEKIFLDAEDNGIVKDFTCQCPMGQFRCHHVAAALLFGYKRASKTDVKCSWLKHPKSAPPKSTVTMSDLYPPKQQEYRLTESLKKRILSTYNLERRAPIQCGITPERVGGQLFLTGTECCDLVVWTTKDLQIIRILRDKTWISNIATMLDFYFTKFLEYLNFLKAPHHLRPLRNDLYRGTGLDSEKTAHTAPDAWPGQNKFGKLLQRLADNRRTKPRSVSMSRVVKTKQQGIDKYMC
uniref:Uncharacterized protein n=1 Tax=Magallana gigas TaxID=29159 RepID=K1QHU7_MAGGI